MADIISKTAALTGFPKDQYFSENMRMGDFGLGNLYAHANIADSSTLTTMGDIKAFSDLVFDIFNTTGSGPVPAVAAQDSNGTIFARLIGTDTWYALYQPTHAAAAIGLYWDGRYIYYVGTEKIGRGDLGAGLEYIDKAGTVAVTNGSANIVGTGTAWNGAAQNGKRIRIGTAFYTISLATDATHITLTTNYTGATASGVAYESFSGWNDNWQDMGGANTGYLYSQPFAYEGDIIIPRQDRISRYNYTDGSFNADGSNLFNAPDGYYWRCGSGGQNGVLMALEPIRGGASYLVLWDNRSIRSINSWIPVNSTVQAIVPYNGGWVVVTEKDILFTNGYSYRVMSEGFDTRLSEKNFSVVPNGAIIVGDRLIIANSVGGYNKKKSGIYIYNLVENNYEYAAGLGNHTYQISPYAVWMDLNKNINVSYTTTLPAKKWLSRIADSASSRAYVISKPMALNGNVKYLGAVKADMMVSEGADVITGKIHAKVASINRRIWGIQQSKVTGTTTTITVNGTLLNDVQVGDEVTIMQGTNAGYVRHITAISGTGTATEVWTLDTALPNNTEANAYISVTPFQLVDTKTISSETELRDMFFNARNRPRSKQYLVKLVFEDMTVPVEVESIELIAGDQGARQEGR